MCKYFINMLQRSLETKLNLALLVLVFSLLLNLYSWLEARHVMSISLWYNFAYRDSLRDCFAKMFC